MSNLDNNNDSVHSPDTGSVTPPSESYQPTPDMQPPVYNPQPPVYNPQPPMPGMAPPPMGQRYQVPPPIPNMMPTVNPVVASLQRKISSGRVSLLLITILSAVNVVLLLMNATISFPFSLSSTTILTVAGQQWGSIIPLPVVLAISAVIVGIFLLLYFLSKKYIAAVWIALGLFVVDTLCLFGLIYFAFTIDGGDTLSSFAIDIVFHIWALVSLIFLGVSMAKMKKATATPPVPVQPQDPWMR